MRKQRAVSFIRNRSHKKAFTFVKFRFCRDGSTLFRGYVRFGDPYNLAVQNPKVIALLVAFFRVRHDDSFVEIAGRFPAACRESDD